MSLLLTVGVILASSDLFPDRLANRLELTRSGVSSGEFWRLWTSALVHFGPVHAGADALALFVGGFWFERRFGPGALLGCLLAVAPLTAIPVLVLDTGVQVVRGSSALGVFLVATAWFDFWARRAVSRLVLAVIALVFLLRQSGADLGIAAGVLPLGVKPAVSAHLIAVLLAGLTVWQIQRRNRSSASG